MLNNSVYVGQELELFASADNWNNYLKFHLQKYIKGNVLEVGAGIGTKTKILFNGNVKSWLCLEPDAKLASHIDSMIAEHQISNRCSVQVGTIDELSKNKKYDVILYIDVIEHLKDDTAELNKAIERLNKDGLFIVLVPAHNSLYSRFDSTIGHFRRYNKSMFKKYQLENVSIVKLIYLDSFGLIGSCFNKVLNQSYPTSQQIWMWDKILVSLSRMFDRLTNYQLGKSALAIWKKDN
jgi:predicted O-methyltransferase YrrM